MAVQRWEYLAAHLDVVELFPEHIHPEGEGDDFFVGTAAQARFSEWGRLGWELVAVSHGNRYDLLYFKRPLEG